MPETAKEAADYIHPLNINGLEGRMLRVPSTTTKQREILLVYGHHAMLERWWTLIETLRQYGPVTMPDLPGFGGMDSFYKIGSKPSLNAYADYLAAFIKLRYKQKRVTIIGISYGFVVVTRMLQRYPELAKKVDISVGIVGFMHRDDFVWSRGKRRFFRAVARLFATRVVALFIRYVCLNRFVIKTLDNHMSHSKQRFIEVTPEEFEANMDFEVELWQKNDVRTHWLTSSQFFTLDNTKLPIKIPVVHVESAGDHYLNNISVEQHMRKVFSGYTKFVAETKAHTPHITANKKETGVLIPSGLRRILGRKP